MTTGEAIKHLDAIVKCMEREVSGTDINCIKRNCDECYLCYEMGNVREQIDTFKIAILILEKFDNEIKVID